MVPAVIHCDSTPQIAGTRITVFDVLDYLQDGWHHSSIAATLRISSEEVLAAVRYIEEHRNEVMRDYQRIFDRDAAGNPPELRARLEATHERFQAILRQRGLIASADDERDGNSG